MPERPLKVEKLTNQTAKPTGSPSHSAISQNNRGLAPNSAASMSASVASISCSSFSYSASSRTKDRTSPASPGRARRIRRDIRCSHRGCSYGHCGLDVRVRIVAFERKVLVTEREDILDVRIDLHDRQWTRRPRQLQPRLFQMVGVEMRVAERVHEIAGLQPRHLRDHHGQQRIRHDVEGHAEEYVGGALIELAGQLAVGDVELKQAV